MGRHGRSGLSELLGAVFVIALGVIAAITFTGWLTGFTLDQSGAIKNDSAQQIECTYAGLFIEEAVFDDINDEIQVTVRNSGSVDLQTVGIHAFMDATVLNSTTITGLTVSGPAKTGVITYTGSSEPTRVRAVSQQCPDTADEETRFS